MRLKEAWTGSYVVWEWDLGDLGMWQDNLGMRLWLSVNVAGNWEWDLGDLGMWQDNLGMRLWLSVNAAGNWE